MVVRHRSTRTACYVVNDARVVVDKASLTSLVLFVVVVLELDYVAPLTIPARTSDPVSKQVRVQLTALAVIGVVIIP